jgi:hypothetical protein
LAFKYKSFILFDYYLALNAVRSNGKAIGIISKLYKYPDYKLFFEAVINDIDVFNMFKKNEIEYFIISGCLNYYSKKK